MGAYFSIRPPAGYYSLSQRLGGTGPEGPAFLIHSHVWLGVGAPDQFQHELYRSVSFLVPEPDPSHGEEEGLGMCLQLSCPHGMQLLCVVISNQPHIQSQSTCLLLLSTFVRHSRVTRYTAQ